MNSQGPTWWIPVFFAFWIVLGIGGATFFLFSDDAALKRKVWRLYVISAGVLFAGFLVLSGAPPEFLIIAIPAMILITFLNMRSTRFCDACGKTLFNQSPFFVPRFCSRCGARLRE